MAQTELTDADVFGPVGTAPVPPVASQPLPAIPGRNSYGLPFTPGAPGEMSDADVLGATATAPPKPADFGLGFYAGLMKPLDRAAEGLSWAVGKTGLPTDQISHVLGLPSASEATAAHGAFIDRQPVRPGIGGQLAGNVVAGLALPGGPAVQGAQMGALLSDSNNIGGIAKDAAIGSAGSKLASGVVGTIGKLIAPKVAPAVSTLIGEGVPMTPGQITGGSLHRIEDAARSIPIFGDVVAGAQKRSVAGLNRAVANRALAPIGETLPDDIAPGRDAIAYAGDKLSQRYNALMPSLSLATDAQLGSDLRSLGDAASVLPAEHSKMLGRVISQSILEKIDPATGVMDGAALKDAETTLGQRIARYRQSPMPADQDLADGLTQTRQILRDWVSRSNPAAAEELNKLNAGWANLAIGENAASRLGATDGLFTPGQLAGAVRASNDTVRKRGYARGTALMQDLSDAALERLPSTVPDSGSPFRHALEAGVAALVGKEAGVGGAMGRASLVGGILSAPYTSVGQPIVQDILAGPRPAYSPALAAILKKLQPAAGAIGAAGTMRLTGP